MLDAPVPPEVRKDRRQHGGIPPRLDDDALAERTEQERVEVGLADYDPDDVPPATDDPVPVDFTGTDVYRQEVEEIDREVAEGVLPTEERPVFPPTRYPER
ncbi:MAG: hypothetical protein ACJ73E_06205 [Mycobacteriales bacterium]